MWSAAGCPRGPRARALRGALSGGLHQAGEALARQRLSLQRQRHRGTTGAHTQRTDTESQTGGLIVGTSHEAKRLSSPTPFISRFGSLNHRQLNNQVFGTG